MAIVTKGSGGQIRFSGTGGRLYIPGSGGGGGGEPEVIMYSIGSAGTGGNGGANGTSGGTTTLTFRGITLMADGGTGGYYNTNVNATGGTATGGDINLTGGTGEGSSSDTGSGGGGGIGEANAIEKNSAGGDDGAQSNFGAAQLTAPLSRLNIPTVGYGLGGGGGGPYGSAGGLAATGFGSGGGGAGWWGGPGGDGLYGGGGGGASGGNAIYNGGNGGTGAIVLSFVGGTPQDVVLTSGTSYTVPAGTTQVRAWVVGGGGGGAGVTASDSVSGGGGGAGGVAVKTWTISGGSPYVPLIATDSLIQYLDAGVAASYPGSGTTWYDLSGNENDAVASGTPVYTTANGGGFTFDNQNDYFDTAPRLKESYVYSGLTVAAWVKANSLANSSIMTRRAGAISWDLGVYGGKAYGVGATISSSTLSTSTMYYIAFTIQKDGTAKLFINGVQDGSTYTNQSVPLQSNGSPVIGTVVSSVQDYGWKGDIYQIQMYSRALTDSEMLSNFNAHKSRYGL